MAELSQTDLAEKLSLTASLINKWERGGVKPQLVDAFRLEVILEIKDERISQLVIAAAYMEATGFSKTFPTHGGGIEKVAGGSSVQSNIIEIGEIGGKRIRLKL